MTRSYPRYPLVPLPEALILSTTVLLLSSSSLTGSFAYEFSFFLGIVASITFSIGTAVRLQQISRRRAILRSDLIRSALAPFIALGCSTLFILFFVTRNPTCRWDIGFGWFLLLPVVSTFYGTACGLFGGTMNVSRSRAVIGALLPTALFSLLTVRDLLVDPPLFFLHPAFGYFAGPIYDEWVPITRSVVTHRLWVIALSFWLIAYGTIPKKGKTRPRIFFLLVILSALFFRDALGWFHSAEMIERRLSGKIDTGRLVIHYDPNAFTRPAAALFTRTLEFRTGQILDQLGMKESGPVDVYVYGSGDQKQTLTGTRGTTIGNPIQRRLHLLPTDVKNTILPHELTHVLAAPMGVPGLGLSLRVGLLEGLATAVERYRDDLSLHEWAAGMAKLGILPDLEGIMSLRFWEAGAGRAYLAAGSFSRWLIDTHGMPLFRKVYRGAEFSDVYGRPLLILISEWERFLTSLHLSDRTLARATELFNDRPIFDRQCPHDLADGVERVHRCLRARDIKGAREALADAVKWGKEPANLLLRQAALALGTNDITAASDTLGILRKKKGLSSSERARVGILEGDIHFLSGDLEAAKSILQATQAKTSEEIFGLTIAARLRLLELGKLSEIRSLAQQNITPAWFGEITPLAARPENLPPLLLASFIAWEQKKTAVSAQLLDRISSLPPSKYEVLRLRLHGDVAESLEMRGETFRAYQRLSEIARTEGERLFALDQIERLRGSR